MKTLGIWGCAALSLGSALGCSQQDDAVAEREQFASCDDGRPSTLHVARDLPGPARVAADGNEGFWLFTHNSSVAQGVLRLDHQGAFVQHLDNPVDARHSVEGIVATGDGGAVVSTARWASGVEELDALLGPPTQPEVIRMEADWSVGWRTPVGALGSGGTSLVLLPDGGVVVAGLVGLGENGAYWARVSPAGEVLWQRSTLASADLRGPEGWSGQALVLGSDGRVRLVLQSPDGLLIASSDLDGEAEREQLLDTRLALSLAGATALPEGRLAILSDRQSAIVTLVDAEGSVVWEKGFGRPRLAQPEAIAFNPVRGEILVGGSSRGEDAGEAGTWLQAISTDGEELWTLEREALDVGGTDGVIGQVDATRGPILVGLAVAPDGTALGTGFPNAQLSYFRFGMGECP